MHCVIYKGRSKAHTYLYVEREDDFGRVPSVLLELMGELEKVMELCLDLNRSLVNADTGEVMQLLESQGYYLQMPPERHSPLHTFLS
jgi:hypothetical protein